MLGSERRTEEVLHGLPVTLGGSFVVAGVVWDSEAVVGGGCLDRMGDTCRGQRLLETVLLLVGEQLVLNRPGHKDGGLDGARVVVGAGGGILLGPGPDWE